MNSVSTTPAAPSLPRAIRDIIIVYGLTSLGASWLFPIIWTTYFFLAFFSFTGANWIVAGMTPHRKFGVLPVLIAGLTYAITSSAIRWIPACTWLANILGVWTFGASPVSPFWSSGTYTADNVWLLFFMVGCSINFGLPVLTQNWPFR